MSEGEPVERLIEFDYESVSGESICENIQALRKFNLQRELCRAQTYDGAGSMAGRLNGCAACFQREIPEAVYYHCASHQLDSFKNIKYKRDTAHAKCSHLSRSIFHVLTKTPKAA